MTTAGRSWVARIRDHELQLLDEVGYTSMTHLEGFNVPDMLSVDGDLDDLREAMVPGTGLYVTDENGDYRFSGWLTSVEHRGDDSVSLVYAGDMIVLRWRRCWPTPGNAWGFQSTPYDVQSGPAETRLLAYINRNAGPGAFHQDAPGSDPGSGALADPYVTFTPTDRTKHAQSIAVDPGSTDFYISQATDNPTGPDDLRISRFSGAGAQLDTMTLPKGGHGTKMTVTRIKGAVYCTFSYRSVGGTARNGTWVRLPYTASKTWTATQALAYKIQPPQLYRPDAIFAGVPPITNPPVVGNWLQGEVFYGKKFYRLYGTPYIASGSTQDPAVPARIDIIQNNVLVDTIDVAGLGRDGSGNPLGGRLEPEGLTVIIRDGQPCLLIGISTGTSGSIQLRTYTYPIAPSSTPVEDRRVSRLRVPASLGRGPVGKTSARFEVLNDLVAALAESGDLRVRVIQTYTGTTPYLDVVVDDAPDLSDWARFGNTDDGGPGILAKEWRYKIEIPVATVMLSAAGGEGADRVLTSYSAGVPVDPVWVQRIEGLIDQRGTVDADEILDGLKSAYLEAAGATDLFAPIDAESDVELGTEVPVGAKVTVLVDGAPVVDRIREITTSIEVIAGRSTKQVDAAIGSADAGPLTPDQKKLKAALRRLSVLERR